mgnify:CR=1 FL=1
MTMKRRTLIGTTSLLALGLAVGVAQAQDKPTFALIQIKYV